MATTQSPGELFDPLGEHLQDPYPFYARARAEEPVFFSERFGTWVVTRYQDVRMVLSQPEVFSSANALRPMTMLYPETIAELQKGYPPSKGLIESDGQEHRRLRDPIARGLSKPRLDKVEPFIRQRAEALVAAFADGHVELMGKYALRLPAEVITRLFDMAPEHLDPACEQSYRTNLTLSGGLSAEEQAACARDWVTLQRLCGQYAVRRRERPGDDLFSEIAAALAPADGPPTVTQEGQLARAALGVFIAGHITTSALIGNALRHLLTSREQWELLCDRPELIPAAVEEVVRFDTPVQGFFRVTTRPAFVGGVELPDGASVLLLYGSANRDPALCDQPDQLDVAQRPTRHLGFSAGPHTCVGAGLARREIAITLETLTRRLPSLQLAPDQEFRLTGSLSARTLAELHLTW